MLRPRIGTALLILLIASAAFAGDAGWQVSETAGNVRVLSTMDPDDRWSPVKPGDLISALKFFQTGRKGEAILVQGHSRIRLYPGTKLEFPQSDPHPVREIYQTTGRVTYTLTGPDPVRIVTPWLVSTTTWGTVTVTIQEGFATVEALQGKPIIVSRFTGRATVLDPAQMVQVDSRAETLFQAAVEQAAGRSVLD
jgi:hypothetical protein